MNTLTRTTSYHVSMSAVDQPSYQKGANPQLFQTIAIGALLATAVGINLTGAMHLCSSSGPMALMVAWFVLPVTAISSIAGAATSTHRTTGRYLTASVAVGFTALWLFGLAWAHVGDAINQVAC